ncbi:hypothetical protein D3C74_409620 [compost metagenome]
MFLQLIVNAYIVLARLNRHVFTSFTNNIRYIDTFESVRLNDRRGDRDLQDIRNHRVETLTFLDNIIHAFVKKVLVGKPVIP